MVRKGSLFSVGSSDVNPLLDRREADPQLQRGVAEFSNSSCVRIDLSAVRISGLMAAVRISIGDQQITSIITARSARQMQLKPGQTAAALIKAT
jgi:molybdopterin-binding protein